VRSSVPAWQAQPWTQPVSTLPACIEGKFVSSGLGRERERERDRECGPSARGWDVVRAVVQMAFFLHAIATFTLSPHIQSHHPPCEIRHALTVWKLHLRVRIQLPHLRRQRVVLLHLLERAQVGAVGIVLEGGEERRVPEHALAGCWRREMQLVHVLVGRGLVPKLVLVLVLPLLGREVGECWICESVNGLYVECGG
jgi:hypothetical protein